MKATNAELKRQLSHYRRQPIMIVYPGDQVSRDVPKEAIVITLIEKKANGQRRRTDLQ